MRRAFIVIAASWLCAGGAFAQAPPNPALDAQLAAMERIENMLGEWLGQGWFMIGDKRVEITQWVLSEAQAQGQVFSTRDKIQRRVEPLPSPRASSFGVFTFDEKTRRYRGTTYFEGQVNVQEIEVSEPNLITSRNTAPDGSLRRFRLDVRQPGVWLETMEVSRDAGATWTPLYEVTMRRAGER
jgi:hypothetical protein